MAVSVLFGTLVWVLDAFLDAVVLGEGPFLDLLVLGVPAQELSGRFLMLGSFLVFGFLASALREKLRRAEEEKLEVREEQAGKLARVNERFTQAADAAHLGVWEFAAETGTFFWDDWVYLLHGVERKDFEPTFQAWLDLLHPDDREGVARDVEKLLDRGTGFEAEYRIVWPDGTVRHIKAYAKVNRNEDGLPLRITGVNMDVTQRARAEARLRESRRQLQLITDNLPASVTRIAPDFRFTFCNQAYADLLRLPREEIIGKHVRDVLGAGMYEVVRPHLEEALRGRRVSYERPFRADDPEGRFLAADYVPETNPEGRVEAVVALIRDVTEQVLLQEEKEKIEAQYRHAQKMEAVGRLSGGVAHDLNNMLAPILGYGEVLLEDFPPEDDRRRGAEQIVKAGYRARDLVRQLLTFSRKQPLRVKPARLNHVVQGFEKLLRRMVREDVTIRMDLSPADPVVEADVGQVEQVLMNLAVNAQDAMPGGGLLTIETRVGNIDYQEHDVLPSSPIGPQALLVVTDTGHGMSADVREKAFEPFFTTKEVEKGTGLGLATVYGVMRQHGGGVGLRSAPGKGTSFACFLPLARHDAAASATEEEVGDVRRGSEIVLVVEDQEIVREMVKKILQRQGYTVFAAEGYRDCLELLDRPSTTSPDLLLTDIVLPDRDGRALADTVLSRSPDTRVLFMSGHSDDVITHRGVLEEGIAFIQKPFTPRSLSGKVREVLDDA